MADARRLLPPELADRPVRPVAWALAQALVALPYYRHTNPYMTASARYAIRAVLGDEFGPARRSPLV